MLKYHKMCVRVIILVVFSIFALEANAQDKNLKYKYKLGLGVSLWGRGDYTHTNLLNEFDYKVLNRFEMSLGLGFGKGLPRDEFLPLFSLSTFQINLNGLILPINNNFYKLKLGSGISMLVVNKAGTSIGQWTPGGGYEVLEYSLENHRTVGYNLLVENEIRLYKNFSTSLLLFGQFYQSRDTNVGAMLKVGYSFQFSSR